MLSNIHVNYLILTQMCSLIYTTMLSDIVKSQINVFRLAVVHTTFFSKAAWFRSIVYCLLRFWFCYCGKMVQNRASLANFCCSFIRFCVLCCLFRVVQICPVFVLVPECFNVNDVEMTSSMCLFTFKWLALLENRFCDICKNPETRSLIFVRFGQCKFSYIPSFQFINPATVI